MRMLSRIALVLVLLLLISGCPDRGGDGRAKTDEPPVSASETAAPEPSAPGGAEGLELPMDHFD